MRPWVLQSGLVLFLSLLASGLAGLFIFEQRRGNAEVEVEAVHSELELALATLAVRMSSMASALERVPDLTPLRFAEIYKDATEMINRVPERALAFMPQLESRDGISAFIAYHGQEYEQAGYPDFQLFPAENTGALFPVLIVEPETSRANVFGYNMGSSPERLSAARDALARGVMTTSAPVALSQDQDLSQASFLMFYPVYLREADPLSGAMQAVIGAGMTPAALLADHVVLRNEHLMRIEIEIGIAETDLPVVLGNEAGADGPTVTLIRDLEMPVIRTNGFDVPFRATVYYSPTASDAVFPLLAAVFIALLSTLALRVVSARASAKQELEIALANRESELREAYRIQARSQRIEALGRLVGGVAHDFNNILSVILGNTELLKDECTKRAELDLLEEVDKATMRGAHLTRQLLSVGRQSHLEPQRIVIAGSLQDTTNMLRRVLPESIDILTVAAAGLWTVNVDPQGLQNALLNLGLNARDAMGGHGKLTIEAANSRITRDYLKERLDEDISPGRYVVVSVSDTGEGMTPDVIDRAFEPFFTTKHVTDGSGLGLPSVLGFCRQSEGTCRIYSEPGVGTTVRMWFPAVDNAHEEDEDRQPVALSKRGGARVLLAEDEDGVARVLVRHLDRAGYTVKRVSTGDAAWAEIERRRKYDVLITDLVMPGAIQGAELARRVEQEHSQIRVLLISGYPQEAAIEGNGVATRHPVLTKPIPRDDLLTTLDALLSQN
ncbi:MAG: CHASE domain-containing protein [Pelagibaca sp.]